MPTSNEAERIEAIGRLAGGIAHVINNLLTVIKGQTEQLLEASTDPDARLRLESIEQASDRAAVVVEQLLTFSRRQPLAPRLATFNEVLARVAPALWRALGERVGLVLRLTADPWTVLVDEDRFGQVILQLAANARDAMPSGGVLVLRTENVEADDDRLTRGALGAAPMAALVVRDTGVGMSETTRARIFEPFFTTRATRGGVGLGLAVVHGIVAQSGGEVLVESTEGQGSVFTVLLPRVADSGPVSVSSAAAD